MMYSAYKLNKQHNSIQPWRTPFPIWNQSVVPCTVLTVASWPAYRFLKRQVRWSGIPISSRIFRGDLGGHPCPSSKEVHGSSYSSMMWWINDNCSRCIRCGGVALFRAENSVSAFTDCGTEKLAEASSGLHLFLFIMVMVLLTDFKKEWVTHHLFHEKLLYFLLCSH